MYSTVHATYPSPAKIGGEHIIRPIIGLCCGQFLSCHHQPRKPAGIIAHCSEIAENLHKNQILQIEDDGASFNEVSNEVSTRHDMNYGQVR